MLYAVNAIVVLVIWKLLNVHTIFDADEERETRNWQVLLSDF